MSGFCGAWARSGAPIDKLLGDRDKRAMLACLSGPGQELEQFSQGPLWLAAPIDKFARNNQACLAMEGFIPFGQKNGSGDNSPQDLAGILDEKGRDRAWGLRLDGHYVLAYADMARGALELYRDPTGGERLYYARLGEIIIFSSSIKPMLAHSRMLRRLNRDVVMEVLLSDLVLFGDLTLWEGVREVLPGHCLTVAPDGASQSWNWGPLLQGEEGPHEELARRLKDRLGGAVRRAIGASGKAAVMLSGGIDSSAIAALAAQEVGAENVHAFTYEYDEPSHASEVPFAASVCRHLGIRNHHVVRISQREYLDSILEILWRSESFPEWVKPDALIISRRIREQGFPIGLSGSGVGSHMAYLEDLAQVIGLLPFPDTILRYWKWARGRRPLDLLSLLHPGLEPPSNPVAFRLYYLIFCLLKRRGIIRNAQSLFPPGLGVLVEEAAASSRVNDELEGVKHMALAQQLQHLSFIHLNSCYDVTKTEKACRSLGVPRVSPAYFPSCLPLTHFPFKPKLFVWSRNRRARPGKYLLRRAMAGLLPQSILYRRKFWSHTLAPNSWRFKMMWHLAPEISGSLEQANPWKANAGAYAHLFPWLMHRREVLPHFALWHRMFIESAPAEKPPTWDDLGLPY
ncbi:MAG: hypothetical protein A3J74_00195 [Elusimicrobia bacterium RIFCSPHIGHO2_02_FULL_57_9]|nr:MAG: hypothetical protein A3J74_00195 [Elusimicrobia bacterium RIFCSPHIGHO2_02_FULL_57_9]